MIAKEIFRRERVLLGLAAKIDDVGFEPRRQLSSTPGGEEVYVPDTRTSIRIATPSDRQEIYAVRHQIYARELKQHAENEEGSLRDPLDERNEYLVATQAGRLVGFVAITPPGLRYSIDKYFTRKETQLSYDEGLYEVRLLTVIEPRRRTHLAPLLMYGALRYVQSRGGTTIVAIGRTELLAMYECAGLRRRGLRAVAGAVTYELMSATVRDLAAHMAGFDALIHRMERTTRWQVPDVAWCDPACDHGGSFWEALGDRFDHLGRGRTIISADVLDAWFDPAPEVIRRLSAVLPFALRTSPPTHGEGLRAAIAAARGVPESSVLPGAGSSDLIYAGLARWVRPGARVLILDPMYGEYAHLLERVAGARVDRLQLKRTDCFDLDLDELTRRLTEDYDWVVLVNPNSPTGRYVEHGDLRRVLEQASARTRIWVDETYLDYVGSDRSLERFAAVSPNVVICKSMSKVYALSGARAAYLVAPPPLIEELKSFAPPWAVSLPAQIAACAALEATEYYSARWRETHVLRRDLQVRLDALGWKVTPGCANFLLCEVPGHAHDAATVVNAARDRGLFIRNAANIGRTLGAMTVRIAVKDAATNARMVAILEEIGRAGLEPPEVTAVPALRRSLTRLRT